MICFFFFFLKILKKQTSCSKYSAAPEVEFVYTFETKLFVGQNFSGADNLGPRFLWATVPDQNVLLGGGA